MTANDRVERTILSAAFDSCSERRECSRSNRTGQQPDAKSKEFIPSFGDATRPKSPALRFAIGRATHQLVNRARWSVGEVQRNHSTDSTTTQASATPSAAARAAA